MLIALLFLTEVITSTLTGSYRYDDMGYTEIVGSTLSTDNKVVVGVVDSGLSAHSYSYLYERVTLKQDTSQNKVDRQGTYYGEVHADAVVRSIIDNDGAFPGTCFISSCHVYLYKAITDKQATSYSVFIALLYACTDSDVDVVNLSFSSEETNAFTEFGIILCAINGKLVVASAGNNGFVGKASYPCNSVWTLCVGGVTITGSHHRISNMNVEVDVYAPSGHYKLQNGTYGDGTSGAAALVSGVAALVLSQNKGLTRQQLHEVIVESAQPNNVGIRVVNVAEALRLGGRN